jgi:Flp pilus assembly protein TadG
MIMYQDREMINTGDTAMIKSEKGVSAVEFALIAPLLFVLTFGIIEFSILLFDKAVVTNASREGARAAIVYHVDGSAYAPIGTEEITDVVEQYTDQYLIDLGGTSIPIIETTYTSDSGGPESGGDVTVRVTYTYNFLVFPNLIPLIGGTFDGTIDLVGTTVMRME